MYIQPTKKYMEENKNSLRKYRVRTPFEHNIEIFNQRKKKTVIYSNYSPNIYSAGWAFV